MKGLMKNLSGGLTILKERRIIGLLKECGGVYGKSFGRLTAEEVDCLREREKKTFECWANNQGELYMIEVNGRVL